MRSINIEIVVDSIESAFAAEKGGAFRIELCDNIVEGGTTPSAGMIEQICKHIKIKKNIIIRPRGGDFLYTDPEFEVMKSDILIAKKMGIDGVVLGILNSDGSVDRIRMKKLIEIAHPLGVTFHRAFDMCFDPYEALETIIDLRINRILTSGQEISALEGLDLITELIKKAKERIIIMPGGGINERNILKIIERCHPQEIHLGGTVAIDSGMNYKKNNIFMGKPFRTPEYQRFIIDQEKISQLIEMINQ